MNSRETLRIKTPDALVLLSWNVFAASLVNAGIELQLWAHVAKGYDTAAKLARFQSWDLTATEHLMNSLTSLGLLKQLNKRRHRYSLTKAASILFLPWKPTYIGNFLHADYGLSVQGFLSQVIRTGRRPLGIDYSSKSASRMWAGFSAIAAYNPRAGLARAARQLSPLCRLLSDRARILDLGCGPAIHSMSMLSKHRLMRATLVDRPQVLHVTQYIARKLLLYSRISWLPGNITEIALPAETFDLVWISNVINYLGSSRLRDVIRLCRRCLRPGGIIAVKSSCLRDAGDISSSLRAMSLFVSTKAGQSYTVKQLSDVMRECGFGTVSSLSFGLVAQKPY